jgi:hypothetical protein
MKIPSYPNPIDESVAREFCHPDSASPLHHPCRITLPDGNTALAAGNGYIALLATRALVLWDELPDPAPEFLTRWFTLPWETYPATAPAADWRPADTLRASCFKRGHILPWQPKPIRPAPTPLVQYASTILRLSHLQQILRLPGAQIYSPYQGPPHPGSRLWFRFAGGWGILPQDPRLLLKTPAFFLAMPKDIA